MGESFKALGLFFLGIIFGLLIKYLPVPQPFQAILDQSLAIVIIALFIIAVVLFVKG